MAATAARDLANAETAAEWGAYPSVGIISVNFFATKSWIYFRLV